MSNITIWVCAIGLGLAFVVWSMRQSGRPYSVRLYDVWMYDALGCRIELGVVTVADETELIYVIRQRWSHRFKTRKTVYWEDVGDGD